MTGMRPRPIRSVILGAAIFTGAAFASGQSEWVVHSFAANALQGTQPMGNLVADSEGNLYGTTEQGGAFIHGTVYELVKPAPPKTAWTEVVLYNFTGADDGNYPFAGVVFDKAGNLYGTTYVGGAFSEGTVFELIAPGRVAQPLICRGQNIGGAPSFASFAKGGNGNAGSAAASAARSRNEISDHPTFARKDDEVQMMRAVSAMQAAGHRTHGTSGIVPALAKNARTGHPEF
jgi:uncharacterized repeat protein (TIGR03803 family)